jgi:UDP-glucuronate decarboxylase
MAKQSKKRALVTGGAGFLGSHLCDHLLREGHEVICLDNFYTGNRENIRPLLSNPHFEVIRKDIAEPSFFEVDTIYNLACAASPIHYQKHPIQTLRASIVGAMNMLEIARHRPETILFQASTSEIYGDPKVHPQREDYWGNVNSVGPRACYDEGKRCAETLCYDYHRQYNAQVKIARIFNTYGPRMLAEDGRAVSNFIVQALKGDDITIYGDGSQTRSFCFYTDTIGAFLKLMETPADFIGPVNIGNPHEITIGELAESVIRLTGSKSKLIKLPLPQDDPTRRCPDISVAKKELGWQPKVPLEEGLKETIAYFKKVLGA